MARVRVEVHPAARLEMQAAYNWYFERNSAAAVALVSEIDRAIEAISENPTMWPPFSERTRRFVLRRFPFSVVYRESSNVALVVAFAHHRRRPGYWQTR